MQPSVVPACVTQQMQHWYFYGYPMTTSFLLSGSLRYVAFVCVYTCYVVHLKDEIILPQCDAYGGKICLFVAIGIAGKFGDLAVSVETAKFKSANIISPTM